MTGLEIKIARIKAGIKSYEMAAKIGINCDVMSRIENGRLQPSKEILEKIKLILLGTEDHASGGRYEETRQESVD